MDIERGQSLLSFVRVYRLPIFFGSISFFLIVVSIVLLVKSSYSDNPILFLDRHGNAISDTSSVASDSASTIKFVIDVEGAVQKPGVVVLPSGGRVEDAINAAGGLRSDADTDYIARSLNKAMKVTDGMKLYIPSKPEMSHNGDCSTSQNDGDVVQSCGIVATIEKSSQNATIVSINTGSKEQLDTLPGIGPVTAQKIIDNRPYQTIEELVTKKAVGQAVFEKIKHMVSL